VVEGVSKGNEVKKRNYKREGKEERKKGKRGGKDIWTIWERE